MTTKPERYVVYWIDWAECSRLANERGVADEDVEPGDFEESRDFKTLAKARAFYAKVENTGATIEERVNFRRVEDPPVWWWEWDEERVEVEVAAGLPRDKETTEPRNSFAGVEFDVVHESEGGASDA